MHNTYIVLEPASNPDLETIKITDALFPIGRSEPFFEQLPAGQSAGLSRRHARIFIEQGKAYLTDLNSRNGTSLNGRDLRGGSPEPLNNGDLVEFGKALAYRVKLDNSETKVAAESLDIIDPQLVLKPAGENSALDVIVINQFPFLIARKGSIFERYSTTNPEQLAQLSRRHAAITLQDGELYLEDLGSRNGTEINGQRLDEHARHIVNGDTLSFGGDHFTYTAHLPPSEETTSVDDTLAPETRKDIETDATNGLTSPEAVAPESIGEHTMFVDSPTSFLDIFCDDGAPDSERLEVSQHKQAAPGTAKKKLTAEPPGKLSKVKMLAREIGKAFQGESNVDSKTPKRVAIGVAILAVFALAYTFYPSDVASIKNLSAQGEFSESAKIANSYLSKHPQNSDIDAVATKAIIHSILPDWLSHIDNSEFAAASQLLLSYQTQFPNIRTGMEYLDLLAWVGLLEQFIFESGGIDGQIDIFDDEIEMKALLDYWNNEPNRYRQILAQLSTLYPEFVPLQKKVLSQVRQLRHSYSLYGSAVNTISTSAIDGISSGNMDTLLSNIRDTEKNYPRLVGLDALARDADKYQDSLKRLQHADLGNLIQLHGTLVFETALFQKKATAAIEEKLPDENTIYEYQRALAAWKKGDASQATAILFALKSNTKWPEQVAQEIDRFQKVEQDFHALEQSKQAEGYADKLLDFSRSLKPSDDSHYIELTRADFDQHRDLLIADMDVRYATAADLWKKYKQAGGISSVLRIEDPVSRKYRLQADRLSTSLLNSAAVVDGYALIQRIPAAEITQLHSAIQKEAGRQRSWIGDLGVVLSDQLLKAKLDLLPYPTEE